MEQKKDGFDIGFDAKIPESTREELRRFVRWVENNYEMPVMLWVDFEYRHYLVSREKKRVGYLFYWDDDPEQMPILRLPVRTEKSTIKEILGSFVEGLLDYFAWIRGEIHADYRPDDQEVDAILDAYLETTASHP